MRRPPASPRGPAETASTFSAAALRKRPHPADRIVLEVGDFGWRTLPGPSFGSHDVGERRVQSLVAWIKRR